MTKKPLPGIVFSQFFLRPGRSTEIDIGGAVRIHRRLVHGVDRGERLAVVEPGAGHRIVDRDRPEQRGRNALGQGELVVVSAEQEVAVSVDESHWVLRADILHVDRHARARRIGEGEEAVRGSM